MRKRLRRFFVLFLFSSLVVPFLASAEGTKQILPSDADHGKLQIQPGLMGDFAWYDASGNSGPVDERLCIHIENIGEIIYYGLGDAMDYGGNIVTDVTYRIKDPSGVIVVGPSPVPASGAGYIPTFNEAVAGPSAIVGATGYNALSYTPTVMGDFFIEFHFNNSVGSGHDRTKFKYFDITVASAGNAAIDGRVWSKAWQMTTDDYGNHFLGKLFVYADDGVVTSINFNSMDPFVFTVSCNQYGCYNTGNFINDRRSVTGNHRLTQYKIFLNDPDPLVYVTGVLGAIVPPILVTPSCTGTASIQINVNKAGNVSILLNINPLPGVQAEDVTLSQTVVAGLNTLNWNGLNGLGQPVPNGAAFDIIITYINGLTNLPIYDVEANPNGFIVQLARPTGADPLTYWNDALVGGGQNLNGCTFTLPTTGCHSWTGGSGFGIGDNNTINTWWYAVSTTEAPINFTTFRTPVQPGTITGPTSLCPGSTNQIYWIHSVASATSYNWSYTGTGATITQVNDTTISVNFSNAATSGNISVSGQNVNCGAGPVKTLAVTINPTPVVSLAAYSPVCISVAPFALTGGSPAGGTYWIGGVQYTIFNPATMGAGTHNVTYIYTDPTTLCTAQDIKPLVVNPLPVVNFAALTNVCVNSPAFTLTGGTPAGGTYSGTGVTGTTFTPATAGPGTFNITYTYTDANSCTNTAVQPITVYPMPTVTLAVFTPVCQNVAPFALTGGSPAGGVYSGPGVSGGVFDPGVSGVGTFTIWYKYTTVNGCTDSTSRPMTVNPVPGTPGAITGSAAVCQGDASIPYSIVPVANALSYTWTLVPAAAGVITGNTAAVTIIWSSVYSGTASLTVAGVNNCGNGLSSPALPVLVRPKPVVTYSMCTDSITIPTGRAIQLKGGIPLGGTYSGTGVNSAAGTFNPGGAGTGTHPITYNFTNVNGCANTATKNITVVTPGIFTCGGNMKDVRDNKLYSTVQIGTQCWMAVSLNFGTSILSAAPQFDNCVPEKYCFGDNPTNCTTLGGYYQWDEIMAYGAVSGSQGLCPPGWHIPSESEWTLLFNNYTNNGFAGAVLKASGYSGFNALVPGAGFLNRNYYFSNFAGFYWSSDSHGPFKAWAHAMNTPNPSVSFYPSARTNAFLVRCLKD
jgi:uncharacterized protein (TIGR02145 family)